MANESVSKVHGKTMELATFYVGEALCGMDILKIQEINKHMQMTKVPQAPDYVMGILNLRGQIVTIIDLAKKLSLPSVELTSRRRNIIVNSKGEYIGLMATRISDVIHCDMSKFEPPPANIGGIQGRFFTGVFKTDTSLVGILDLGEVLKEE
jgi:purine-binding chemotaxis protein CheW